MLGVRDITLNVFFENDTDYIRKCRQVKALSGFQGGRYDHIPFGQAVLKKPYFDWLRANVGPRRGENFVLERTYYPNDPLPPLGVCWQNEADLWPVDKPRWDLVPTLGFLADTIAFDDDEHAMAFYLTFQGELIEMADYLPDAPKEHPRQPWSRHAV